jgi:hypothetical protein
MKTSIRVSLLIPAVLLAVGSCTVCVHAQNDSWARCWQRMPASQREAYNITISIEHDSLKNKVLTSEQVATLVPDVVSPNMFVRLMALAALRNAGTQQATAAEAAARHGLIFPDSVTRTDALTTLDHLNAPDVTVIARQMLSDPSHYVTDEAHKILDKRGDGA